MPSKSLTLLDTRLLRNEALFLPLVSKSPPKKYTADEIERAAAYLLFAHAEIELFLEERCKEVALSALEKYESSGQPSKTLTVMLGYFGKSHNVPGEINSANAAESDALKSHSAKHISVSAKSVAMASAAVTAYFAKVEKNNGVKEKHVLELTLPLGVHAKAFDSIWLAEMSTFGSERGNPAHVGISAIQSQTDPFDYQVRIKNVLNGPKGSVSGAGAITSLISLDSVLGAL